MRIDALMPVVPGARAGRGGGDDGQVLWQVCRLVGAAGGQRLQTAGADASLSEIAARNGLAARQVRLQGEWYRSDLGALIGYKTADGAPVALLRRGRRYRLVDGRTGEAVRVNAAVAAGLQPLAASLQPRLRQARPGGRDLLALGLASTLSDWAGLVLTTVVIALYAVALPLGAGVILNHVLPTGARSLVLAVTLALLVATLGYRLCFLLLAVTMARLSARFEQVVQFALWDRLLRLYSHELNRFETRDLADRADFAAEAGHHLGSAPGYTVMAIVSSLFALLVIIAAAGWVGALSALAVVGLYLVAIGVDLSGMALLAAQPGLETQANGFMFQLLQAIPKLKIAGAERRAIAIWNRYFGLMVDNGTRLERRQAAAGLISAQVPFLFLLIMFGLELLFPGHVSANGLIEFNIALGQFTVAVGSFVGTLPGMLKVVTSHERARAVYAAPLEERGDTGVPVVIRGALSFENVSFGYEAQQPPVIRNLSFSVAAGEFVAIVGPSGSGKSTLTRLLTGLEVPWSGVVAIDGRSLAETEASIRSQIGVVLQGQGLIPGNIFENIAIGTPLPIEEAWAAAILAGLQEDLLAMPMGLHTLVGDGGGLMSRGQAQRILLARAIARQPRLLILDEATSALDNTTQAFITGKLAELGMTRLVVAHRLSTVRMADRIIVMKDGEINDSGTYAALLQRGGLFAELAERQL